MLDVSPVDIGLLSDVVASQPYPLVFATVSGAHLYGFPSVDSDYDLRGTHVLPLREVVGLDTGLETLQDSSVRQGIEVDIVTHDVRKFFTLMLRPNGYVLEQLLSPIVVKTTSEHAELKMIARSCITRRHSHHYLGFARSQWRLFEAENPRRAKPLLYVFRVLLTGIYLMRTGVIEANLPTLNAEFGLQYVPDLIGRKLAGGEQSAIGEADLAFYRSEYERLIGQLEDARDNSHLPDAPSARPALHDLLVRLRLATPTPSVL